MLEDKIYEDYVKAMKDRDSARSSALSFLRAKIKDVRIEKRIEKVEDIDVVSVIKRQIKQRQDSIEQFKAASRQELVDKETFELNLLKSYLPQELSEDEIRKIVSEVIAETQASSIKDMGKVMKAVGEKIAGRADNRVVSELVKKRLSA
ncbi:MAG TPA: GatB/YqeY domain-containing protein [Candidatus Omnitrophota bacterium]|nr:GatB/YqeY domain-containing protein [Candidatus Omnitrophota bacterium]HPN88084.1 GatB/YqeY domain-containing protein [Candidatus Omnitrophota bacterium]